MIYGNNVILWSGLIIFLYSSHAPYSLSRFIGRRGITVECELFKYPELHIPGDVAISFDSTFINLFITGFTIITK